MEQEAIVCQGVSRNFGARTAVSDLSFRVASGSVFGFLGPNGAGKTTTVRMLIGMLRPSTGSVQVLGKDPITQGDEVRSATGVMLDNVGLYERLSAYQNLVFAGRVARLSAADIRSRVEDRLHRVNLWDRRSDRVSGFSKGMRQKLGLARALMSEPQILILDEPTAGLDPSNIVMVRELLVSLAEESGRTIFLCTHLLAEAQRICDRVAIIQSGHILAQGNPNQLGAAEAPTIRLTLSGLDEGRVQGLGLPDGVVLARIGGQEWRATVDDESLTEHLVAHLVTNGIGVRAVVPERISLEDEYMRLIGGTEN